MDYRNLFKKTKWSQVPTKDLPLASGGGDEGFLDGDSSDTSTLLGEKANNKPGGTLRRAGRGVSRFLWLVHVALLGANITWWLTWDRWAHPADVFSTYTRPPSFLPRGVCGDGQRDPACIITSCTIKN